MKRSDVRRAAGALAVAFGLSALTWAGNLDAAFGIAGLLTLLAFFTLMYLGASLMPRARLLARARPPPNHRRHSA